VDADALAQAASLASRQHNLITYDQALEAGLSPDMVRRLVEQRIWIRVARGIYRINGVKATWRGRMMAACLQAGDDALISHRSAAALWGLDGFGPPMVLDLTVPPGRRPRVARARVHRRTVNRRAVRDSIPVTPIPETILDLCAVSRNRDVPLRALDDVRRRRLVSTAELQRCFEDHSGRGQAGTVLYRQILERRLGKTPPGSVFSAQVLDLLIDAGVPEPEAEVWVTIDGRRYRIDLAYPRVKIAIECLGKIGHLNEKAFEEDPVRSNDFALDGWLQLFVTYRRYEERPTGVVAEVETALAVRGAA
jgi:hypothetical protein